MARVEKPYRVYRGGRVKGKVPLERRSDQVRRRNGREPGAPKIRRPRKRWSWPKRIGVTLIALILLFAIWAFAGYMSVRGGVKAANKRLPADVRPVLVKDKGSLLGHASDILLLGTDHLNTDQRVTDFHSDSIILMRTDPGRHRLVYLSIPRDLRVYIPGHGEDKINAAMQIDDGDPRLAIRTVQSFTGLPVNHVLLIDFGRFRKLIDNLGGVTINVPEQILSNRFDCPYGSIARCDRWQGWRFAKGPQHMNGLRAEIYSRIRENQLNPGDNDITRGERQQQVLRAVIAKLTGFSTFVKAPFSGGSYVDALTTDLSAWNFVELAWVMKRASASSTLHCRLGGNSDPTGSSDIIPSEDNRAVIGMVTGAAAAQPPRPGTGTFGPGCFVGRTGP